MKAKYYELKDIILKMNNLNDKISLIKFNNDEGPKFKDVKEMKDFISNIENGTFDFLFDEDNTNFNTLEKAFIETYELEKENYLFYLFTYKRNCEYITYLNVKSIDENNAIFNMCGNITIDKEKAHAHFDSLKKSIENNDTNTILDNLITGAENTLEKLKIEYNNLTSKD